MDQTDSEEYSQEEQVKMLHYLPQSGSGRKDEPIINIFSFMGKQIDQDEQNEAEKTLSHADEIQVVVREQPKRVESKEVQQSKTIEPKKDKQQPAKLLHQKSLTPADLIAEATCPDTNFTTSQDYEALILTSKRQKKRQKAIQKQKDMERRLNRKRKQQLQTVFNGVMSYF